ncbi:MAG: NADH dehydrogenase subunit [Bacteroidia bacterium]|nr:NADH dehydrogenase subunit [Bacteroidia bacterium]
MNAISLNNNERIVFSSIPVLSYDQFMEQNLVLLENDSCHCISYFGFHFDGKIRLVCCIADDTQNSILVSSAVTLKDECLPSFTAHQQAFHAFEREISENMGIGYTDHPWLKPVRYPANRADRKLVIGNYPFYSIDSDELHEVGVGPVHAGVIEPGHFRFICNGEQILHLEIQLGYQHRGIESLFLEKKNLLQKVILAESIAGDTVAGHTTAFVNLWESLCNYKAGKDLQSDRTIALEIERIAVHTGDLAALSNDIAYQPGSAVFGRLRTPLINHFQLWCGNRLAKGLIRPAGTHFPYTGQLADQFLRMLESWEPDFNEMWNVFHKLPGVMGRLEKTGILSNEQVRQIGAVGITARSCNLGRDIRSSHPHDYYSQINHQSVMKRHGDVYSRAQIRREEIRQSLGYLRQLVNDLPVREPYKLLQLQPEPGSFAISLVESWRGEICHCAVTDKNGELMIYKVKDPSFHNWMALALAVRNNEISDFPVCNKSFNLSYCGHDL